MRLPASSGPERRRTPRLAFGAVAEVTATTTGKYLVAITTEISRLGCFVKTTTPFPAGETVMLRITYDGSVLEATSSSVVYTLPSSGMGIAFGAISPREEAVLEHWLAQRTN